VSRLISIPTICKTSSILSSIFLLSDQPVAFKTNSKFLNILLSSNNLKS
jgi:hypothetical protein